MQDCELLLSLYSRSMEITCYCTCGGGGKIDSLGGQRYSAGQVANSPRNLGGGGGGGGQIPPD